MLAAECLGRLHCKRAARYRAQGGDNMTAEEGNELLFAAIMYRRALGGADTHHKSGLRELLGDKHRRTLAMARNLEEVLQAMEPRRLFPAEILRDARCIWGIPPPHVCWSR